MKIDDTWSIQKKNLYDIVDTDFKLKSFKSCFQNEICHLYRKFGQN